MKCLTVSPNTVNAFSVAGHFDVRFALTLVLLFHVLLKFVSVLWLFLCFFL